MNDILNTPIDVEFDEPYDSACLYEMAGMLPDLAVFNRKNPDTGLIIAVGSNEGNNVPHFHVFWNKNDKDSWINSACLYMKENRYFDHGKHREFLNRKEFNAVVNLLQSPHPGGKLSNWEFLIYLWNSNSNQLPYDLEMPEYDYRTVRNHHGDLLNSYTESLNEDDFDDILNTLIE